MWRTHLYKLHADPAAALMREGGYTEAIIERVKKAIGKRGLKVNPETQVLEDVTALVFIEHYMLEFASQKPDYNEEKWLGIIRKTWEKMSPGAHGLRPLRQGPASRVAGAADHQGGRRPLRHNAASPDRRPRGRIGSQACTMALCHRALEYPIVALGRRGVRALSLSCPGAAERVAP
jgi:hypothetical protein